MNHTAILLLSLTLFLYTGIYSQSVTSHIHIDQFGYQLMQNKVAVISDPIVGYNSGDSYTPGTTLKVIDADTGSEIFTASPTIWNSGNTHSQSGDRGWWFDFSSVVSEGNYYILDPTNNTKSHTFTIAEDVHLPVLKSAMKMFYYNRCNATKEMPYAESNWTDGMNFTNNLQDANCRNVYSPADASLERDLSGGWFDAGDYNKYVTFARTPVHNLLYAYEESTEIFLDNWNIPESGNGIPDILDELIWEIQWIEKMMNPDGSVIIKMGNQNYAENISSPPSSNTDQRFYGNTCTSASIATAGMLAHAALVFQDIPLLQTYANQLKNKAITALDYAIPYLVSNTLEENCDDISIVAGDADMSAALQKEYAVLAAVYLFELTDSTVYENYIIDHIQDVPFVSADWLGGNTNIVLDALLHYASLPGADAATVAEVNNSIMPHVMGDWNDFFGMNSIDLYRAFIPDWGYNWGSNLTKAQFGILNLILEKHSVNPSQNASYNEKAREMIPYFHGVNPQNIVYLSNMYSYGGDQCVNEIYHTWFYDGTDYDHALNSLYGPAPGYVSGGPNAAYTYSGYVPPYGQPQQKSYKDFNDGGPPINPWEISEPAIYYQAGYIRLIAAFAKDLCASKSVLYVDSNNSGPTTGASWSEAYSNLSDALTDACLEQVDTIRLAEGTYIPAITDRNFTYDIPKHIVIDGGYSTGGIIYDPSLYESILSGNIGSSSIPTDNLFHTFRLSNVSQSVTLKNITIRDGYADGVGDNSQGAGIFVDGNIILEQVKISDNQASGDSPGIYLSSTGQLQMSATCDISNNSSL